MNRKTFLIIALILIIALAVVFYIWWPKQNTDTGVNTTPQECLVFQSDDINKPCYIKSTTPTIPSTPISPVVTVPSRGEVASSTPSVPTECTSSTNVFERNDCVTRAAVSSKNTTLCTLVSGSLAQSVCVRDVGGVAIIPIATQNQSYETFLRSISSVLPISVGTTSSVGIVQQVVTPQQDARFTPEGLTERFKNSPLALFSVSPYQVMPGGIVTLQGTGFADMNDIHVGGYLVSTSSTDGFTLSFPAPSSAGEYDVWITNKNGSSQVVDRTMRLTVTTNPAPLPVVLSVNPNPAQYGDMITISGTGFSNTNTVSSSLGLIENIPSSGGTISLRISDFSLASKIKEISYMKGIKTAILLYIQSEGGLSKEPYSFEVQF